jgi:hypothetical protein
MPASICQWRSASGTLNHSAWVTASSATGPSARGEARRSSSTADPPTAAM